MAGWRNGKRSSLRDCLFVGSTPTPATMLGIQIPLWIEIVIFCLCLFVLVKEPRITNIRNWIKQNIIFISWGKHWKGVYLHFFPYYCVRVFLWGIDWHLKPRYILK
jgi:hypothetical protein